MSSPPRLHALDNLRATMMWLGIVLHVAAQHTVAPSPLPWHDPSTTRWADLLTAWIHAFRMPVFFIVAGFFAVMLAQRLGWAGLLRHRWRRLAVPFLLLGPPIVLSAGLMALVYWHAMQRGQLGLDLSLWPALRAAGGHAPVINTMHLWFLYQLWWFIVLAAALGALGTDRLAWTRAAALARRLGAAWWGPLVLALPLAVVGAGYPNGIVVPRGSLWPPLPEWLHNGLFFAFGAGLHAVRADLLPRFERHAWRWLLAGLPFFLLSGALVVLHRRGVSIPQQSLCVAWAYNVATWCWCFGLIGLFSRHLSRHQPVLAYLADSSYWVYLMHLTCTIGFGALLYNLAWSAGPKMIVNIGLTTAVGLASYQLLVRHTALGRLLNGPRRQPHAAESR